MTTEFARICADCKFFHPDIFDWTEHGSLAGEGWRHGDDLLTVPASGAEGRMGLFLKNSPSLFQY
jgi:hypothetical protein